MRNCAQCFYPYCQNAECFMLNVVTSSVIILNVAILNVVTISVIMPSVVMANASAAPMLQQTILSS